MSDRHTDAQGELLRAIEQLLSDNTGLDYIKCGDLAEVIATFAEVNFSGRATEGQAQTSAARFDAKLLVDVATGVIGQWNMLETYDEEMTERFCKQLEREFAAQLADSTAPGAPEVATVVSKHGFNNTMSWLIEPALPVGTKLYAAPTAQQSLTAGGAVPEWKLSRLQAMIAQYGSLAHFHWPLAPMAKLQAIMTEIKELSAAPLPQVQSEALKARKLVGYAECRCILKQYCDGQCRPIFADQQPVTPSGALADNDGGVKS